MEDNWPPLIYRVISADEPDAKPVELNMAEIKALMVRSAEDVVEFVDTINNKTTRNEDTGKNTKMSIEVSWDVDENVVSEEAQTTIMSMVAAGIILVLKDSLKKLSASQ